MYVHVPFCATACDFCAFYQEVPDPARLNDYMQGLALELASADWDGAVQTCFIGGGTPGVLAAQRLRGVLQLLTDRFSCQPVEWTVELDPTTVTREKLEIMAGFGVNRLSIGAQSFSPDQLRRLGRKHQPRAVRRAVGLAREVGFHNINIDLMFAYPGQTADEWREDITAAVELQPTHISTYCLTLEEDTALYVRLLREGRRQDADAEHALYVAGWDELGRCGYEQYEVSNFARPGFACLHNLHTWSMGQWLGFGPAAASQWRGRRRTNIDSIEQWLAGLVSGSPVYRDDASLDPETQIIDAVIFGLRMKKGIDWSQLKLQLPTAKSQEMERTFVDLETEGLVERLDGGWLRLSRQGLLLADAIAVRLM